MSEFAALLLCAPATQRYVAKRSVDGAAQLSRVARLRFVFVRANAAPRVLGAVHVLGLGLVLVDDGAAAGDGD